MMNTGPFFKKFLFLLLALSLLFAVAPVAASARAATGAGSTALPPSAEVKGMWGYGQLLGLSCESRSAADWARHFGIAIHELPFLASIPRSANPEEGFVGSPDGVWGSIPPHDYGVHAAPVAKVLRTYAAPALALRKMPFERLKAEIAAGRPVIVWVVGHVETGTGVSYRVGGKTVTVARYEHTVIVTGYDAKYVTILDGKTMYKRPVERFLASWSALENMAVIWDEHGYRKDIDHRLWQQDYAK